MVRCDPKTHLHNKQLTYSARRAWRTAKARATLGYFDTIYFAARVHCPALVCVGLIDETVRPASILSAYNAIHGTNKELMIFPFFDHSLACGQLPYWHRQDE